MASCPQAAEFTRLLSSPEAPGHEEVGDGHTVFHLESSIKFTLDVSSFYPPISPGEEETQKGARDSRAQLAYFVSPDMEENLYHRLEAARTKCSVGEAPRIKEWLSSRHQTPPAQVVSAYRALGSLYYPLSKGGFGIEKPSMVPESAFNLSEGWCGWWTQDLDELVQFKPHSLWVVNVTKGLHWLSSPEIVRDETEGLIISGIPGYVEPENVISESEMCAIVSEHFRIEAQRPLTVFEIGFDEVEERYKERSRGFILAPDWSPLLLCEPRPIGIKRSMMNRLSREGNTHTTIWGRDIMRQGLWQGGFESANIEDILEAFSLTTYP